MSAQSPGDKPLQTTSLVVHATRGVLRDQRARRKMMVVLLAAAAVLLVCGMTVLRAPLDAHEHPWRVIIFWLACVWLTFTAMLLALFDLLMVRSEARKAEQALRESFKTTSVGSTTSNE